MQTRTPSHFHPGEFTLSSTRPLRPVSPNPRLHLAFAFLPSNNFNTITIQLKRAPCALTSHSGISFSSPLVITNYSLLHLSDVDSESIHASSMTSENNQYLEGLRDSMLTVSISSRTRTAFSKRRFPRTLLLSKHLIS